MQAAFFYFVLLIVQENPLRREGLLCVLASHPCQPGNNRMAERTLPAVCLS